jgi:hypothetical protein
VLASSQGRTIMTANYGTLEAWIIDVSRSSLGSQQRVTTLVHATSLPTFHALSNIERLRYMI